MDDYDNDFANEDDMAPIEVKRVPESQVQELTEEQLNETFTRVVTAADPNAPTGLTVYNHVSGEFQPVAGGKVEHMAVHFQMESTLIHTESEEAQAQKVYKEKKEEIKKEADEQMEQMGEPSELANAVVGASGEVILKNQFNFSGRSTQTFNNSQRSKGVYTEPPPMVNFSYNVTHWDIFDTYLDDLNQKRLAAELLEKKRPILGGGKKNDEEDDTVATLSHAVSSEEDMMKNPRLATALKKMERMVTNNSEADHFLAYKYLEDKNESKKGDGRGSFFPLWKLAYKPVEGRSVTGICWNSVYSDLFAVSYGSYDFNKTAPGTVCCYSLKNSRYPEYQFHTEHGVTSVDFHPTHASLICVGLYNGSVAVYDVRKSDQPIYMADDPATKHTDPVWQVKWDLTEHRSEDGELRTAFFSVGSDGKVKQWFLSKNELQHEQLVALPLTPSPIDDEPLKPEALEMVGLAGGCSFDFNKRKKDLFVVGTEEGALHLYSKRHGAKFLRSFHGHHMAVYSVAWNSFHPKVFLSCSADWTVKLWEANEARPVMSFDFKDAVSDIEWSPYSSTVFAVITVDRVVRIYDLNVNKHEPVGEIKVKGRNKLTKVSFNPTEPVISVADDNGLVSIFKLSGNLRRMSAASLDKVDLQTEIDKLNALMIMPEKEEEDEVNLILEQTKLVDDKIE